jgi:hypothetical protein
MRNALVADPAQQHVQLRQSRSMEKQWSMRTLALIVVSVLMNAQRKHLVSDEKIILFFSSFSFLVFVEPFGFGVL